MLPLPILAAGLMAPPTHPNFSDVLNTIISNCKRPADGTIIVCGKRGPTESRFRLAPAARDPGFDVNGSVDSVSRERHKLMEAGAAGTGSCSTTGAGGWTGCMVRGWDRADQQRGFRPAHRFK
jgi:hypothetical protein